MGGAELLSREGAGPGPRTRADAAGAPGRAGIPDPPLTQLQAPGVSISPYLSTDSVNLSAAQPTGVVDS